MIKKNVILGFSMKWHGGTMESVQEYVPNLEIMINFEQVLAMVKLGEISKLTILMGGFNVPAQEAVESIHKIDPTLPILIWNGRTTRWDREKQGYIDNTVVGENEIYLNSRKYSTKDFYSVNKKFYDSGMLRS